MTISRAVLFAAVIAAPFTLPAAAQTDTPANAPIPQTGGGTTQIETGADVGVTLGAGALPGVGIGTATTTDVNSSSGPGGLQNGVGAHGVMMPDATGEAGNTLGRVPGTSGTAGFGIPIDTTPRTNAN